MPRGTATPPNLDRLMELSKEDRAYIAGFFDGEGWVSLSVARSGSQKKERAFVIVGIAQKQVSVLTWIHSLFGGTLFLNVRNDRGYSLSDGSIHRWSIAGREHVRTFYQVIRPYMRMKGDKFDLVMRAVLDPSMTGEEAKELASEVRKLK